MAKGIRSSVFACALGMLAAGASAQSLASDAPQGSPGVKGVKPALPARAPVVQDARPVSSLFEPGAPRPKAPAPLVDPGRSVADQVGDGQGGGGGVADAGITLLDFENWRFDDGNFHELPRTLYEDGFVIAVEADDTFSFQTNGSQHAWYAGSTAIYNNTINGTTYVYAYDFSPFSLQFMDVANFANNGPITVTIYGVKYDGSVVQRSYTTQTTENREETFYFNGFNDLYYVYWFQESPFHQFDNIGIVRAPIIMDFEALEHVDANIEYHGDLYYENGFYVWEGSGQDRLGTFGTLEARYPGSTAMFNDIINGVTGLTQADGGIFNLHSIDLSNLNNAGPTSVTFVGTRPDGFQVSKTFTTSGSPNVLETFQFTGFNNLAYVQWVQESPYHQFDNIVISRGHQTLDFIKYSQVGDEIYYWGDLYRQDGFRLTKQGPNSNEFGTFGSGESRFPGSVSLFNNDVNGITRMETIDGTLFQLIGIELAPLNSPGSVTVDFTGYKSDGGTVHASFTTSGNQIRLETFTFPGDWRGLAKVEWTQASPYHQFDTIRAVRQTTLMDFQKLEHVDAGVEDAGNVYAEEGFRLTKGQGEPFEFASYGTLADNYNGSTSIFNNTVDGLIRLSAVDGSDFDLLQMDVSTLTDGLGDTFVEFTGTKVGGGQVSQTFTIEDSFITQQTIRFVDFDSVVRVDWHQVSPFHQIDNIVVVMAEETVDCYADCDGSGVLDFFDFLCFTNAFNANEDYADCDGSGVLDFFDFLCYTNEFNAGC
jgi:hypothetical protein